MGRRKRDLKNGEAVTGVTMLIRSSVHKKLVSLIPTDGSLVETVELMTEYLYARRRFKLDKQHNAENIAS